MNKITISPYNPFDYLENDEEINEYLSMAFNDEDPHVFLIALGYLAKHNMGSNMGSGFEDVKLADRSWKHLQVF